MFVKEGLSEFGNKKVSIITVTLNRDSLGKCCRSVDSQTYSNWHHYVIGDGVLPRIIDSEKRTIFGFSKALGIMEPGANMPNGTPNPMQRWALKHLELSDYVCFLDDDNIYSENFLQNMVDVLENNNHVGVVLCGVLDRRYGQNIDGFPEEGRCDNSGFMMRKKVAKTIEFPRASMDKNVIQDVEFIKLASEKFGWINVSENLVIFGDSPNTPPLRGRINFLESWEEPLKAGEMLHKGQIDEAISIFQKALNYNHLDAWVVWKLGEAYLLKNEKETYEKYFRDWLELAEQSKNNHYFVLFLKAVLNKYFGQEYIKNLNLAIEKLKLYMSQEPDEPDHYFNMGLFKSLYGNQDECLNYYSKAIDISPNETYWARVEAKWHIKVLEKLFTDYSYEQIKEIFSND